MQSKESIAQNILAYYALFRLTPLLDQLVMGLKKSGILRAVQTFPSLYASLFMYTGEVTVDDVLEAVYVDESETEKEPEDDVTLAFLKRFIQESDKIGKNILGSSCSVSEFTFSPNPLCI